MDNAKKNPQNGHTIAHKLRNKIPLHQESWTQRTAVQLHVECTNKWHNTWHIIQCNTDQYLAIETEKLYGNLNQKLHKLVNRQHRKNSVHQYIGHLLYASTVNLSYINFTQEETTLLNKGLQHSIEKPIDRYWTELIIETEQAIRTLDTNTQIQWEFCQPQN
jgi:hypothetical protein